MAKESQGFTLIELLVVIAIIALLLSIVMPGLNMAKKKAASAVCMTNAKNLSLAWYMYQEENNGELVGGIMSKTDKKGQPIGWIRKPMDAAGNPLPDSACTDPARTVTDEEEIRGVEAGSLFPYMKSPDAYHCIADKIRKSKYDGGKVFVSYTVARCLNGAFPEQREKFNQITSPSMRYNFVESAEERNWNWGAGFVIGAPEYTNDPEWSWWGPLAINHGDSSVLGFCDGHAEVNKWRDPFTRERVVKLSQMDVALYDRDKPPAGQTTDIDYMARGWATRHK